MSLHLFRPMRFYSGWFILAGFFLLIFGCKLCLIQYAGSDLPVYDQWDAEAEFTIRPLLEHRLAWSDLYQAHNEHRLITTKLYSLCLLSMSGQWNGFVETSANAAIHTFSAVVLLLLARRWLSGHWLKVFGVLLFLLFALPFSWENTLVGFQVQFYFLLLFSIGHIIFSLESDQFSWRWALGQLCGVLALASMASGFLSALAVLSILIWRIFCRERLTGQQWMSAVFSILNIIAGWYMKVDVPGHASLHASGVGNFLGSLLRLLAWPAPGSVPILILPAIVFLRRVVLLRSTRKDDAILLGLLAWCLLQAAAVAFGRGGGGVLTSPRYFDLLAVNVALVFVFIITELAGRTRLCVAGVWCVAVTAALLVESKNQWHFFVVPLKGAREIQIQHTRDYVRTGAPEELLGKSWPEIPYPNAGVFKERLDVPAIREILPPSVHRSLSLEPGSAATRQNVPAALPPAPWPIAFSSYSVTDAGKCAWRSGYQPATTRSILRFRIAGDLGPGTNGLRLVVKSARSETAVMPESRPGNHWKTLTIVRPPGVWWIEAVDENPTVWFAVTEPVEIGKLTLSAEKLLEHHLSVISAGGVLLLMGFWVETRREQARIPLKQT